MMNLLEELEKFWFEMEVFFCILTARICSPAELAVCISINWQFQSTCLLLHKAKLSCLYLVLLTREGSVCSGGTKTELRLLILESTHGS